jgi:hypothetical protein
LLRSRLFGASRNRYVLSKEHGSTVTLDGGFARDLEAVVDSHPEPRKTL